MQERPGLFRSFPFVTMAGTLTIGMLWSPVFLAFINVASPDAAAPQTVSKVEFLRNDGSLPTQGVALAEGGLAMPDATAFAGSDDLGAPQVALP